MLYFTSYCFFLMRNDRYFLILVLFCTGLLLEFLCQFGFSVVLFMRNILSHFSFEEAEWSLLTILA